MFVLQTARRVVTDLRFAPHGPGLVAASWGGLFWWPDLTRPSLCRQLATEATYQVALSHDARILIAAYRAGGILEYDMKTKTSAVFWPTTTGFTFAIAPTTNLLVTCPADSSQRITAWQLPLTRVPSTPWVIEKPGVYSNLLFPAHGAWCAYREYAWTPKRRRFTSWLHCHEAQRGTWQRSVEIRDTEAWADAALDAAGHNLAVLNTTRTRVTLWSLHDGRQHLQIAKDSARDFTSLAFHPTAPCLGITSNDGTIRCFDTRTGHLQSTYDWGIGKLRCLAFTPDGSLAAAGSDTGQVVVWDVA